jgi:hypothetical protein
MASKFGRNYILTIEVNVGAPIIITPPFTIEFDITRNILSSANVASIRIYNLSQQNRNNIEFNIYNQGSFRRIVLNAGYGVNLPVIFYGNITQAWSVREGVNFITQIECFDGGYAYNNAFSNVSFPAIVPNQAIITALIDSLAQYNIIPGFIGSYPGTTNRGSSYSEPTCSLLSRLTNGGFFIDNGTANCLGNSECIANSFPLIDSSTGLLGTPVREQQILTFDMIFEPRVQAGQIINLQSLSLQTLTPGQQVTTQAVNGTYKVTSVKHRGIISPSVCGDAITTLGMFLGQKGPNGLSVVA